jgi:sugar O-acyltransferase (sialic acid O-acetyltransferase NeuD family)
MTRVLILGAGGTGRDIVDWLPELRAAGRGIELAGFLDDDPAKQGTSTAGFPILGPLADAGRFPDLMLVDALGSPKSFRERSRLIGALADARFLTIIHPLARVSASTMVGAGSLLYPFVFAGPDTRIGRHVTVLSHAAINHDTTLGEFTILASHVALGGNVTIGASCYLGMRSTVREGKRVGAGAMVGMGAVVAADVASGATVAGVPARPLGK